MMLFVQALLIIAAQLQCAVADLPVHCVRHQVLGNWVFKLGALSEKRSACGHEHPDVEEHQPSRLLVDGSQATSEIQLSLKSPNLVSSGTKKGSWTMIYDEGFEVKTDDGMTYFAFSNFTYEGNAKKPKEKLHNVSHCGETMVGWYQNADRTKFGCYYGHKVEDPHADTAKTPSKGATVTLPSPSKQAAFESPLDKHAQSKAVKKLNVRLGMLQLGWRAREVTKWNGRSMHEVNQYVGLQRTVRRKDSHRQMLQQRTELKPDAQVFLQRASALPKSLDWSDINGVNFLEPVMDQADCGSCYAASSVRMLTARHKITINDTAAIPWSINFPLQCSEYNQGCKGGFGFLLTKWSDDVGLLPATCMPYDTAGSCKLTCDLKKLKGKRYRAANHRYVGSYYGHANEHLIKEELATNGPLAVGIEPDDDFMYYSDGIYKSSNDKQNRSENQEWQQVDHGVLLVGYGEENGQKYWRIQNSWGPDWGEDGFFRIVRGTDEAAIESMAEATDVVEDEQNGKRVENLFAQLDSLKSAQKHAF